MNKKINKNLIKNAIAVIIGSLFGYLYYAKVGCKSGGCPLTSSPYVSIIWGAILGYLVSDFFKLKKSVKNNDSDNELNK